EEESNVKTHHVSESLQAPEGELHQPSELLMVPRGPGAPLPRATHTRYPHLAGHFAAAVYTGSLLGYQGRPGRIRGILRGRERPLVGPGEVDRIEPGRRLRAFVAEVGEHASIGRPGGSLDQEGLRQQPLTGAVRTHHADIEGASVDLG